MPYPGRNRLATRVRRPQPTHEVINQPPPLEGYTPFEEDPALREALERLKARAA